MVFHGLQIPLTKKTGHRFPLSHPEFDHRHSHGSWNPTELGGKYAFAATKNSRSSGSTALSKQKERLIAVARQEFRDQR
jgi:hypothetical protein